MLESFKVKMDSCLSIYFDLAEADHKVAIANSIRAASMLLWPIWMMAENEEQKRSIFTDVEMLLTLRTSEFELKNKGEQENEV